MHLIKRRFCMLFIGSLIAIAFEMLLFCFSLGSPYVAQTSNPCSWTIKSPDIDFSMSLTEDTVRSVSNEICHEVDCGQVYSLTQKSVGLNTTCFTNCVYHNYQLRNCTEVVNSSCLVLSEIKCGKSVTVTVN